MERFLPVRTRLRPLGRWSIQSLRPTTGLASTSATAGGRNRLTRSSVQTVVGTTQDPRRHPPQFLDGLRREDDDSRHPSFWNTEVRALIREESTDKAQPDQARVTPYASKTSRSVTMPSNLCTSARLTTGRMSIWLAPMRSSAKSSPWSVSYTHLRAHETDSYLVCRL